MKKRGKESKRRAALVKPMIERHRSDRRAKDVRRQREEFGE
jgi:hypothetical protein